MQPAYHPDFSASCRICGSSPCVVVEKHVQPDTDLCGPCFFHDHEMVDHELWNDQEGDSDES